MRSLLRVSNTLCSSRSTIRLSTLKLRHASRIYNRSLATLPRLPIFVAISKHDENSTSIIHSASKRSFTYGQLLRDVAVAREKLQSNARGRELAGARIGFLAENSYDYVVTLLSIFSTQSIAVPLSPGFPAQEIKYVLDNSQASLLLSTPKFESKAKEVMNLDLENNPSHVKLEKILGSESSNSSSEKVELTDAKDSSGGMMLYTSGTTARPKGVVLPSDVLTAQSLSLKHAWSYSSKDHLLHVLPLHHIHGIVNAILAPLFAGSAIEFLYPFNPTTLWSRFAASFLPATTPLEQESRPKPITLFTAVPTIYTRLLSTFPTLPEDIQKAAKRAITPKHLRLNISGSAALPTPTKAAWTTLSSGNILLERYGMTEVGMALSCALPFSTRIDGAVGYPLPSVEVRLIDPDTNKLINTEETDGEIQLRGPTIFKEYWNNPTATEKEFVAADPEDSNQSKWFRTGDIALRRTHISTENDFAPIHCKTDLTSPAWSPTGPHYHILGRLSADIIKTGGEKVSALEVERELLSLPNIDEAAVVAVPSGRWGQKVGAVVVLKDGDGKWSPMDMRRALKERLANYKIPQVLRVVEGIERNAMGKINKKVLVKKLFADEEGGEESK